jgi:hypothetical protein
MFGVQVSGDDFNQNQLPAGELIQTVCAGIELLSHIDLLLLANIDFLLIYI